MVFISRITLSRVPGRTNRVSERYPPQIRRPSPEVVLSGDYGAAVATLTRHATLSNWSGVHSDFEVDLWNVTVMKAYAEFISNLSVAFERASMATCMDGHTYVKPMAKTQAKSLHGAPHIMTMGSY